LGITESNLNSSYRPKHNLGTSQTAQQGVSVWNSRVPITVVQNGTEWRKKKKERLDFSIAAALRSSRKKHSA
jgi:hypothetical protein